MNKKDIIFYSLIVIIIILFIYIVWFTKTEGYKCLNSPLVYGVAHISTPKNQDIICTCSNGGTQMIMVTKDNISLSNFNMPSFSILNYTP